MTLGDRTTVNIDSHDRIVYGVFRWYSDEYGSRWVYRKTYRTLDEARKHSKPLDRIIRYEAVTIFEVNGIKPIDPLGYHWNISTEVL